MSSNKQIKEVYHNIFKELIDNIRGDEPLRNMYNLTNEQIEYLETVLIFLFIILRNGIKNRHIVGYSMPLITTP